MAQVTMKLFCEDTVSLEDASTAAVAAALSLQSVDDIPVQGVEVTVTGETFVPVS